MIEDRVGAVVGAHAFVVHTEPQGAGQFQALSGDPFGKCDQTRLVCFVLSNSLAVDGEFGGSWCCRDSTRPWVVHEIVMLSGRVGHQCQAWPEIGRASCRERVIE